MTPDAGAAETQERTQRNAEAAGGPRDRFRAELDRLWRRGCELLGCELAIMGGAMTWVSERNLVAAISAAGGFGVIAAGSMPPELLAAEIAATKTLTSRPFGVNLITMHPRLPELIDVCAGHRVSHVVLAGGLPGRAAIDRIKQSGARVLCFAPALGFARKLVRMGADAIVIEGNEAGGHIGPVSTGVLAQEILPHLDEAPVFVAGGIGRGEAILAYLEMGAAGVQLGTRFVCATELIAHPRFKQAFVRAAARDAVPSAQLDLRFPVIPVRALANPATERFLAVQRQVIERFGRGELSQKEAQLEIEHFWAGALRRAVIDGDIEAGSLMAGQSVGFVTREQSTRGDSGGARRAGGRHACRPSEARAGPIALARAGLDRVIEPAATVEGAASISGTRRLLRRLRNIMAGSGSAQERLDRIVRTVAAEMVAEVCSAYVMRAGEVLELFATEGLRREAVHRTRLRVGEGLVGVIAATARPLALDDAQSHPDYAYRPETGEEIYHSLMGVPILRGGRVLGVLVVQNRTTRHYTEDEIEVLQTIAMVVAELAASGELINPLEIAQSQAGGMLPVRLGGSSSTPGWRWGRRCCTRRGWRSARLSPKMSPPSWSACGRRSARCARPSTSWSR